MEDRKDLRNLLDNFQKSLEYYTIDELNEVLIKALDKKDEMAVKISKVVEAVCKVFECNKRTLLCTSFRGKNKIPAHVLIVFLTKEYELNDRFICKKVFTMGDSSHSAIFRVRKTYKNMNPSVKAFEGFCRHYEQVKNIVNGQKA